MKAVIESLNKELSLLSSGNIDGSAEDHFNKASKHILEMMKNPTRRQEVHPILLKKLQAFTLILDAYFNQSEDNEEREKIAEIFFKPFEAYVINYQVFYDIPAFFDQFVLSILKLYREEDFYILDEKEEKAFWLLSYIAKCLYTNLHCLKNNKKPLLGYFIKISPKYNLNDVPSQDLVRAFRSTWDLSIVKLVEAVTSTKTDLAEILQDLEILLPKVHNVTYFGDFLLRTFDQASQPDIQILALYNLVTLLRKSSLEVDKYYSILYRMLVSEYQLLKLDENKENSLFHNKHVSKFLFVIEASLRSEKLSKNLVASFIKVLLKLSLTLRPEQAIWMSFLVFNLAKKHLSLRPMFAIKKSFDIENDSFDINADVFGNNVTDSCFWEIVVLRNHYISEIRKVYSGFLEKINSGDYIELDEFADLDADMLCREKLKRIKIN